MSQNLKSGLMLMDGEVLVMEIEADLWAASSNPVAQFFGSVSKHLSAIFGYRKAGFVVVTNRRVVEVAKVISCYVIGCGKEVKYLLPSSLKEVGFTRKPTLFCFCPAYHLYYESFTQRTQLLLKGVDENGAQKTVDAFYRAIAHAQSGNV